MLGEPPGINSALFSGGGPKAWVDIDIDVAVTQHAGLRNRGFGVNMQIPQQTHGPPAS